MKRRMMRVHGRGERQIQFQQLGKTRSKCVDYFQKKNRQGSDLTFDPIQKPDTMAGGVVFDDDHLPPLLRRPLLRVQILLNNVVVAAAAADFDSTIAADGGYC